MTYKKGIDMKLVKKSLKVLLLYIIAYLIFVSAIGKFSNPELTNTQLIFKTFNFIMLDF